MQNKPIVYESACILSIAGSTIGFIGTFVATFFFGMTTEKITSVTDITAAEKLSPIYFALLMAIFCVSLAGAIKMYRMQRVGLYFYLTAQLLLLFLPVFWLGSLAFSTTNAIFTVTFISIYLWYGKHLK